ncbi:MAG: peptidoglycan-associated lipoprotein Pal [bacterium]|nr:peptidoglycan-associated lipoprotein Pal [bacterium]
MKSKLLLIGCFIALALFLLGGCAKKAVKKTPESPGARPPVVVNEEPAAEEGIMDEGTIPQEQSSRGINFSAVINVTLDDVYFGYDQYTLTQASMDILAKNVETLKSNPKVVVQVEGHADERGTVEYNLALGQKRASAVRSYLINAGIDSGRIFTISYGKERPLDPGHNEEAWAKNRRAHLAPAAK